MAPMDRLKKSKRVIRLFTHNPCIIDAQEYRDIKRAVEARIIAGCTDAGDRILARLLMEHQYGYLQIVSDEE